MHRIFSLLCLFGAISWLTSSPAEAVIINWVPVGDPGNQADTARMQDGTTGYGAVSYSYYIDKYEVTASQYTAFLNAVAATDTYKLYSTQMAAGISGGAGINRTGSSGSFQYSVTAGRENFPINYVSWGSVARFVNWLQNGQPTGAEGPGTTETGTYTLNGAVTIAALSSVTRNPGATIVLPTDNEWYKAAYYKGGSTNAGYWLYPTQSNTTPANTLPDMGNSANFDLNGIPTNPNGLTMVGSFDLSPGPYGTFDQGGNAVEWNESRRVRGGSFSSGASILASTFFHDVNPTAFDENGGFRVAMIPEPSTFLLAAFGMIGLIGFARYRRKRLAALTG